jgi:hypothetical protein
MLDNCTIELKHIENDYQSQFVNQCFSLRQAAGSREGLLWTDIGEKRMRPLTTYHSQSDSHAGCILSMSDDIRFYCSTDNRSAAVFTCLLRYDSTYMRTCR